MPPPMPQSGPPMPPPGMGGDPAMGSGGPGGLAGLLAAMGGGMGAAPPPPPPAAMPGMASGFPADPGAGPAQNSLLALLSALLSTGEPQGLPDSDDPLAAMAGGGAPPMQMGGMGGGGAPPPALGGY